MSLTKREMQLARREIQLESCMKEKARLMEALAEIVRDHPELQAKVDCTTTRLLGMRLRMVYDDED
jgi:hypothetical protein